MRYPIKPGAKLNLRPHVMGVFRKWIWINPDGPGYVWPAKDPAFKAPIDLNRFTVFSRN